MTNAPERIWIEDERPEGGSCHVYDKPTPGVLKYATEYIRADLALPAVQPDAREAAIREAALREALAAVNAKWRSGADTPDEMRGLALAEAAILAMIDKPAHVNETPKSEHDAANVLTPAKGDTHD